MLFITDDDEFARLADDGCPLHPDAPAEETPSASHWWIDLGGGD